MNTKPLVKVQIFGGYFHDSGVIALEAEPDGLPPNELRGGPDTYFRGPVDGDGVWAYQLKFPASLNRMVPRPGPRSLFRPI